MRRDDWRFVAMCALVLSLIAAVVHCGQTAVQRTTVQTVTTRRVTQAGAGSSDGVEEATVLAATTANAASAYVGNTNTHKFHRASCHYAGCTNCTSTFATREEAVAAGFRPCGICTP
jgi:hypothetical protein